MGRESPGGPTGHVMGTQLGQSAWSLGDSEAGDYGSSLSMLAGDVQHGLCVAMFLRCKAAAPELLVQLVHRVLRDHAVKGHRVYQAHKD